MEELLQQLAIHLRLQKSVVERVGEQINVGERFKVRFTLTNSAEAPSAFGDPRVRFKRPYLMIEKTEYAQPILPDGSPVTLMGREFPVAHLDSGESASLEFDLVATAEIAGLIDLLAREHIATAHVKANLDVDEYFVVKNSYRVREEIDP